MEFTGLSGIAGPDGLDLARAGVNTEVLLVAELAVDREPRTSVFTAGRLYRTRLHYEKIRK